jgi:hypothetical protein
LHVEATTDHNIEARDESSSRRRELSTSRFRAQPNHPGNQHAGNEDAAGRSEGRTLPAAVGNVSEGGECARSMSVRTSVKRFQPGFVICVTIPPQAN